MPPHQSLKQSLRSRHNLVFLKFKIFKVSKFSTLVLIQRIGNHECFLGTLPHLPSRWSGPPASCSGSLVFLEETENIKEKMINIIICSLCFLPDCLPIWYFCNKYLGTLLSLAKLFVEFWYEKEPLLCCGKHHPRFAKKDEKVSACAKDRSLASKGISGCLSVCC